MNPLLLINFAISSYLLGLIVTVQLVHYPSFIYVDRKLFNKFHLFHMRRISFAVMVPMVVELLVSMAYAYYNPNVTSFVLLGIVLLIWLSTALLSVPRHIKLSQHKNPRLISELVLTNWPRTLLWTSRVIILALLTIRATP